jgi:hypothetical protein
MVWVKIDDGFPEHPKVLSAGPLAMAMQIAALCYCNRNLTDGFIPKAAGLRFLDFSGLGMRMWTNDTFGGGEDASAELVIEDLVNAGMWDVVPGGWQIHDYLEFQPSKADILAERDKTKQRVDKWRARNAVTNTVGNAVSNAAPVPVPVPDIKKEKEEAPKALTAKDELLKVLDSKRADAIIEHRKGKGKFSAYAASLLAARFAKCADPNQAADEMIANNWQGFKPEWLENRRQNGPAPPPSVDLPAGMRHAKSTAEYVAYMREKTGDPKLENGDWRLSKWQWVPKDWSPNVVQMTKRTA